MKGIQFVVDDQGEKTAVLLNLQEHGELWEDFYDCLIARARVNEPRESLAEVREQLRQQGKLHGMSTRSALHVQPVGNWRLLRW